MTLPPLSRLLLYSLAIATLNCAPAQQNTVWEPGITARLYDIRQSMDRLYDLVPNQTPNLDERRNTIDFSPGSFVDPSIGQDFTQFFLIKISGQIYAPISGTYLFELESDDGSQLFINGNLVCDNDGAHGPETATASLNLTPGWHDLHLDYFNDVGDYLLQLRWQKPGDSSASLVPQSSLRTDDNVVRVTSPGKKFILNNGDLRPGTGLPLGSVHPAWTLESIRPPGFKPQVGAMTLAGEGTLFLGTFIPNQDESTGFDPQARVWRVDGINGTPASVTATQVAGHGLPDTAQLNEVTGMAWVDEQLFVAERTGIFRMIDDNSDGLYESKELIGDAWTWDNFHQFPFCLKHRAEPGGNYLYGAISVAISLGGNSDPNREAFRGSAFRLKIPPRGSQHPVEYLAGGLRTPNGVGFGPGGDLFVTDNQGGWNPANSITHIVPGRFYGHFNPTDVYPLPSFTPLPGLFEDQPVSPKSVYLPQNEISNSPTDFILLTEGTFAGQLLVGELTAGGLRRVSLEKVNGEYQGAVFRHSQGFEAGINRLRLSPDGTIFVGCMGSNGSWSYQNLTYGLQRLTPKPNPPSTFEIKTVSATNIGLVVEFTNPVPASVLNNPGSYLVQQWRYLPTDNYGGPKIDLVTLEVSETIISDDRTRVHLTLPGMMAGHVLYLRTGIRDDYSNQLWSGEAWYTLNQIPEEGPATGPGEWRDLFNGSNLAGWRGFKNAEIPPRWTVEEGLLTLNPDNGGPTTDLVTQEEFRDFELELEWKVGPDQNSGIFVRLDESHNQIWEGGPEMQIVDDSLNLDGQNDLTRAGSIYSLYPLEPGHSNPANSWNTIRIVADGSITSYHLNDHLVASFDLESTDYWNRVQNSTFNYLPTFGRLPSGPIGFQDYDNFVQFRNIRLRSLNNLLGPPPSSPTLAYGGTIPVLPTRIQAENYDTGGPGVSYYDNDPTNQGGSYRGDQVDIEDSGDSDGTPGIGWSAPPEWLHYTINTSPGIYRIIVRAATPQENPGNLLIHLGDGQIASVPISTTGDWTLWQNHTIDPIHISTAGEHVLRLTFGGEFNLNWIEFQSLDAVATLPDSIHLDLSSDGQPNPAVPYAVALEGSNLNYRFQSHTGLRYLLKISPDLKTWFTAATLEGNGSILQGQLENLLPFGADSYFLLLEIQSIN